MCFRIKLVIKIMNIKQIFIISFLLIISIQFKGQAQNIGYDYPIRPGTDEWKSLKSSQEMIDACQIPADILKNLSTASLSKLCLDYPLLSDMLFSNNLQEGFDIVSSKFNGFQELFKRKNAGSELLKLYNNFDISSFEKNKGKEIKNVFLDICIDVLM